MSSKDKKGHPGALHANKEKSKTIIYALEQLSKNNDVKLMLIRLNKRKVFAKLQDEKPVLYNYVTNILLDRLFTKKLINTHDQVILVASKRETNKFLNSQFKTYLQNQNTFNHKVDIEIEIKTPTQEKVLQIVDLACWACFRKYEFNDSTYYNLIERLIIEDNVLFG